MLWGVYNLEGLKALKIFTGVYIHFSIEYMCGFDFSVDEWEEYFIWTPPELNEFNSIKKDKWMLTCK